MASQNIMQNFLGLNGLLYIAEIKMSGCQTLLSFQVDKKI